MDRSNLLSIGEFSQLTGASIKALHYYEKIQILKPAWIDRNSNYRYYSLEQIRFAEAIELMLDYEIRLSEMPEYLTSDGLNINYDKLFAHAKALTEQRIAELEDKKKKIEQYQDLLSNEYMIDSKSDFGPLWLMSAADPDLTKSIAIKKMLQEARSCGLKFHKHYGRIMFCNGDEERLYYYIDLVVPPRKLVIRENIFRLPEGEYRILPRSGFTLDDARTAFTDLYAIDYDKIVIESEHSLACLLPAEE